MDWEVIQTFEYNKSSFTHCPDSVSDSSWQCSVDSFCLEEDLMTCQMASFMWKYTELEADSLG